MKYEVRRYFSSFVTFEIKANTKDEAYEKSKEMNIDLIELQNNLQDWEDANEIIEQEETY